jgi:hypothetical protein
MASQSKSLAQAWENDAVLRRNAREIGSLTRWKHEKLIGLTSTQAMTYNTVALEHLATYWTAKC